MGHLTYLLGQNLVSLVLLLFIVISGVFPGHDLEDWKVSVVCLGTGFMVVLIATHKEQEVSIVLMTPASGPLPWCPSSSELSLTCPNHSNDLDLVCWPQVQLTRTFFLYLWVALNRAYAGC